MVPDVFVDIRLLTFLFNLLWRFRLNGAKEIRSQGGQGKAWDHDVEICFLFWIQMCGVKGDLDFSGLYRSHSLVLYSGGIREKLYKMYRSTNRFGRI